MLGIILCGGQSLRMGRDKGLLTTEAQTWAQAAYNKIAALGVPVKISVNGDQHAAYSVIFPDQDLITDDLSLPLKGPLLGVLSSHVQYPADDLIVLACDMPLMEPAVLKELYTDYERQPSFDAYIYTHDGEPEPLCGIYTSKALAKILTMHHNGSLPKHSMKFMLEQLSVNPIAATDDQKKYFSNFNAHTELNGQ